MCAALVQPNSNAGFVGEECVTNTLGLKRVYVVFVQTHFAAYAASVYPWLLAKSVAA